MLRIAALAAIALAAVVALLSNVTSFASFGTGGTIGGPSGGTQVRVDFNVQSDTCGHDPFIWGSSSHNLTLNVVGTPGGPTISISGPSPFVNVSGTKDGNTFFATGMGQVGPNPNATVQMQGTWDGTTLTGTYTMGSGPNDLPPCGQPPTHHPAVYTVKPKRTPTPTRTPTRTPTPSEKLFSITVLKLDDDSFQPLPGWEINLFSTSNCQGLPFDSDTTDSDGLVDFIGLPPGTYSIQEKLQPGWNPVDDICQDVTLGAAGTSGLPPCPIQPDQDHPQPGCDTFVSGARVNVRINATGEVTPATLNGPTQIARRNKPADKDGDGLDEVNTEVVAMELDGAGVTVRESPSRASLGVIEEQQNTTPGTLEFPANSYFDVFFEIDVGSLTLHNEAPFRLECKIDQIPPVLCFYLPPVRQPVILLDSQGMKIATLLHGMHIPLPPNEVLVVFSNRPKATATPTRTSPPGEITPTPTRTPPPGEITLTPTRTNTPTKTPQEQLTRSYRLRCSNEFTGVKFTGKVTITEKKPGQPDRVILQASCNTNTAPTVTGTYSVSRGARKNYALTVTPAGGVPRPCPRYPSVPAFRDVRLICEFSPDGAEFEDGASGATTFIGDVNCDGTVNSLDALLELQFDAALVTSLACQQNADVNDDGAINSTDAALTLQFDARLIHSLPAGPLGAAGRAAEPSWRTLLW